MNLIILFLMTGRLPKLKQQRIFRRNHFMRPLQTWRKDSGSLANPGSGEQHGEPISTIWGIYPGGQSGNPGSKYYDNMVDDWVKGNIYELLFLKSPDEKRAALIGATMLRGVK